MLKSNATILGISETKLDNTIMDSELNIEGYDLIRSDRNRRGDGVACYIKKDRQYNVMANCPTNFENIVALVATTNAALLRATQNIYVCNVKTWTYVLLSQATG